VRSLIVNADDFGLTPGIHCAVAELYAAGALTSATLMAGAPAFIEAVAWAQAHPSFGVGCHVVLVDGKPVAPPETIPTLLDPASSRSAFYSTLGGFVRALLCGRIRPEHIEREASAQLAKLRAHGIQPTHIDTHKHTHMFSQVLAPVLRAAQSHGVRAIRNPFEPAWSVRATPHAPLARRAEVHLLRLLRTRFLRSVRAAGLRSTDGSLGVLATGTLDAAALRSILARMPDGVWELVCHPAHVDDALRQTRTRLLGSRQVELQALLAVLAQNTQPDATPQRSLAQTRRIHFGNLAENIRRPEANPPLVSSNSA
jgi:predicted glycoside hydrolase/deacetylase ChbG (UPF0249 family)